MLYRQSGAQLAAKKVLWSLASASEPPVIGSLPPVLWNAVREAPRTLQSEGYSDAFAKQPIMHIVNVTASSLGNLREAQVENSFSLFSQFSTSSDSRGAVNIKIWFPFLKSAQPLDISIIGQATVREAVGYILFQLTEDPTRTSNLAVSVRFFQ